MDQVNNIEVVSYSRIAGEYYDPDRHPTCADFRATTKILLERFLGTVDIAEGRALEVGAGRSLVAECYSERGSSLATLVLSDASIEMLNHSMEWREFSAGMLVMRADKAPFDDKCFTTIYCCLGDPYNDQSLWRTVERLLVKGGKCFFSTPAFEWACQFRMESQRGHRDIAEFVLERGERVYVPSRVFSAKQQSRMIANSGLRLTSISHAHAVDLPTRVRSPKLQFAVDNRLPVVTAFVAEKPT